MNKRIMLLIAFAVLVVGIVAINSPYLLTKVRSKVIGERITIGDFSSLQSERPPLILLHGFNPTYSKRIAEFSLITLQKKLTKDLGYINKGLLVDDVQCVELLADKPIIVRVSYLNGINEPNVEAYAHNLGRIIQKIQRCTGTKNVDIIAHSMGGIVVRYYLASVEEKPVRKLIMVATPNTGGIYSIGQVQRGWSEKWETDMDFMQLSQNSSLMRTLGKTFSLEGVTYYTIAGNVDGKGDGLVLVDSVIMPGSQDSLTVDCNHIQLRSPDSCPEAYEFMANVLRE